MNELEKHVIAIKKELTRRQSGSQKPIYNKKLQQFLKIWFKFKKLSSLSENDKEKLAEIQMYFDKNNLIVYSKKHPTDSIRIDELSLYDRVAVRLKYIESDVANSGIINVIDGLSKYAPYSFQQEAMDKLTIENNSKKEYAGLVVLPTGGGKTFTAVYWLLQNILDNRGKILWIAHRHSLLDQALNTFKNNAYSKDANGTPLLRQCKEIRYQVISGLHGKARSCHHADDIVIASKDSISSGVRKKNGKILAESNSGLYSIYYNWLRKQDPKKVFIVIDEAHHAIGKSYRLILDYLKENRISVKVLGLTATPIRLSLKEEGLLSKVFPDNITYSISINNLLDMGFLAYPNVLEEVRTGVDMTKILSKKEMESLKVNDIDSISKKTAEQLGDSPERNNVILTHYLQNKTKYGQTIIFALNVQNAVALAKLFNEHQIKSEYVLSGRFDQNKTLSSAELNSEKIEKFKNEEVTVLISYNILTEGLDVPKVQTIFLARPTISPVLMTQMIGRGLRGEKVGGTKETFIVPFIDEWYDLISWISPTKLLKSGDDFPDSKARLNKHIHNTVSANTIEQLSLLQDNNIDKEVKKILQSWEFIERVPVGLYIIDVDKDITNGSGVNLPFERESNILVYNHLQKEYADFVGQLPSLLERKEDVEEELSNEILETLVDHVESTFFVGLKLIIGYSREDIKDIIRYYNLTDEIPEFIPFEERSNYDIDKVAKEFFKKGYGGKKLSSETQRVWNDNQKGWQTFLGIEKFKYFNSELELALNKLKFPEEYKSSPDKPTVTRENLAFEKMPLEDIKQHAPDYYKFLRDQVFKKSKNRDGYFHSIKPYSKSKNKINFELAYKVPLSNNGLTVLSNLCLKRKVILWPITTLKK